MSATLRWWLAAAVVLTSAVGAEGSPAQFEVSTLPESSSYLSASLVQMGNGVSIDSFHSFLLPGREHRSQIPFVFYGESYRITLWFERPARPATIMQMLLELLGKLTLGDRGPCVESCAGACKYSDYCKALQERPSRRN
jgi:hypothetical protein